MTRNQKKELPSHRQLMGAHVPLVRCNSDKHCGTSTTLSFSFSGNVWGQWKGLPCDLTAELVSIHSEKKRTCQGAAPQPSLKSLLHGKQSGGGNVALMWNDTG